MMTAEIVQSVANDLTAIAVEIVADAHHVAEAAVVADVAEAAVVAADVAVVAAAAVEVAAVEVAAVADAKTLSCE